MKMFNLSDITQEIAHEGFAEYDIEIKCKDMIFDTNKIKFVRDDKKKTIEIILEEKGK